MKKANFYLILLFFVIGIVMIGCSGLRNVGSSTKKCGCETRKGFVGY